jgi:hypothetical protein
MFNVNESVVIVEAGSWRIQRITLDYAGEAWRADVRWELVDGNNKVIKVKILRYEDAEFNSFYAGWNTTGFLAQEFKVKMGITAEIPDDVEEWIKNGTEEQE